MEKAKIKKSETTSLSHKSSVGTSSSSSTTWNGTQTSKYLQRQQDELTSKMDTLQHEFTQQDIDEDGYITLKQLHSLFSSLNLILSSQLQRFINLVALHKSNLVTPGGNSFSFQETQQYHFLLERVAGMQPFISQKYDTNILMKIVNGLDEPSGMSFLKDIYQTHELAFMRTMFQSLHRDQQGLIPFLELQSAVRKLQQENPKLPSERVEEILTLIFEKSTTNGVPKKQSSALVNFAIFAKGFIILETVIGAFPLLGGNDAPATTSNGTTPHPSIPTTPITKTASKGPSTRSSVASIHLFDQESDDEALPNNLPSIPIVPPVTSPRQAPSAPALNSQMAYTYDPTPELFIEEVAPYRITPHSPGSEPPLSTENQAYQIRSRWKLYPVGPTPTNANTPQKFASESVLQTPAKSPPSRSPTPKLAANGTPSMDSKLAVEKRITEEIIKLRQQLLEQRRKLADANLMYQHQQQTHEESIVHLKDNHQHQLDHLQQQIDALKNQMKGGQHHTFTHKSVNTELNIAELLLRSENHNNNNAALQHQYDEQSQAIEELRRNLEQLHIDETQLKRQLIELQEVNEKLKESLQENDDASQENAELRRQIQELSAELEQANNQKNELQVYLTETQQTEVSLKTHVSTLVQQHKHTETNLKTQLNDLNMVKEDQDKQLNELIAELQKYKQYKSEMEALQKSYQDALSKNTQNEETIKKLNEKLSVSEKKLNDNFGQYQNDVSHLTEQHQSTINTLQEKLTQVQQSYSQQEQKWKQEQQQQRAAFSQKLQEFEKEMSNYSHQVVEMRNLQEKLKSATTTQQEQHQEISNLQQTIREQRQTIEQLQSKSSVNDTSREKLQQELDQLKRTLQEKDQAERDLSKQVTDLKTVSTQQLQDIDNLQKQLHSAQQGFQTQQEKIVNEFKKKETELQKDSEKFRTREQELLTEISTLKSQNSTAVQQNQQLVAQVQTQNQQHSNQISELQRQLRELQEQNKKLSEDLSASQTAEDGLKKQINEHNSINEDLLAQVEQYQRELEEARSKHQTDTNTKVKQLQDDINSLRQQLNTANREKTEHSQHITQLQSEKDRLRTVESNLTNELRGVRATSDNLQNQLNQAQQEINNLKRTQSQANNDAASQKQALEHALNQAAARIAELEALQTNQQDSSQQVNQKVQQIQQQYAERETEFRNRVEKEKLLWKQKLKAQTDEVTNAIAQKLNEFSAKLAREAEQRIQLQQQNQQLQQRLVELSNRPMENGSNNYDEEFGALNGRVRHQNDEIELLKKEIDNLKLLISRMENDEQASKTSFANFQKESKQAQELLLAEKTSLETQKDRLSRALIELNSKLTAEKNAKPDGNRLHLLEVGLKKLEQENKQLKAILKQHEINFENLGSPRGSNSEFTTRRVEHHYVTHSTPQVTRSHSPHHHIHYPSHDMPNFPTNPTDSNSDLFNRVSSLRNRLDELNSSPSPIKSPPSNFVNTQHHYDFVYNTNNNTYRTTHTNNNSIPSTPQPPTRTKTPQPPTPSESEEEPMDKYFQAQPHQLPPFYEEDEDDDITFSPPQEFQYQPAQPPVMQQQPAPQPVVIEAPPQALPQHEEEPIFDFASESEPEPEYQPAPPATPNTSQIEIIPTDSPLMDLGNSGSSLDEEEESQYGMFDLDKFVENEIGTDNNNKMMADLAKVYQDDEVSKKLAAMVASNAELKKYVPFNSKRLEKGVYQIGNKKLQMKVINRELMVRVGGGYMKFEDYLKRHSKKNLRPTSESEMKKEKEAQVDKDVHSLVVFPRELKQQQEPKKIWK